MALEIAVDCIFIGVVVTSLRVLAIYNRFEEVRRDAERDR